MENNFFYAPSLKIEFDYPFSVEVNRCSLSEILLAFKKFVSQLLPEFIMKVLLGYAEYTMSLEIKPFSCDKCCNNKDFIWKTKHGKKTKLLTIFQWVVLQQLQVQCKCCLHKFYITRKLLGVEPLKRIPEETQRKLGLIGALASFRVSEKIIGIFGVTIDKMTIWKAVQNMGKKILFNLDPDELAQGEADGTGIGIQGIKKRGKEVKIFVQHKRTGGIRIAGVGIGNYHGGWDKLFKPVLEVLKGFKTFLLITDGDTSIFKGLGSKVKVKLQRCLWHIPHQLKFTLWTDKVKRKTEDWLYILAEAMEICAIRSLVDDEDVIASMVKSKLERLDKLISFCKEKEYNSSAEYLENAKPDMFTAINNRLNGKTTSRVERVMRTVNLRANVGKWSPQGALNATKIRLAYYYNGFDA